ncbi:PEP-CTERM sorting domain-containing protein [Akkermansia muciniphila]|nr:PEP-CTERM sorting domain-containing protein [Akkermansia muciniphila]
MRSMGWNMVPEPATATLSLLGLAALALRRRRC